MKRFMAPALIAIIAIASPAFAQAEAPSLGRLAVSEAQMNSGMPLVFISASGQIISPAPTDPALWTRWEATQQWISQNFDWLNRELHVWQSEYKEHPEGTLISFVNDRLQRRLGEIGALTEIQSIDDTMNHLWTPVAENEQPTPQAAIGIITGCGPRGTCMAIVNCCTTICNTHGACSTECHMCDCGAGCWSCCGYGEIQVLE